MGKRNRYFILRHGESVANTKGLISSSLDPGQKSFGLTRTGRHQVAQSTLRLVRSRTLPTECLVISSPLLRAVQSAQIVVDLTQGKLRLDERLRERGFGSLDGKPDSNYDAIWRLDTKDPTHQTWGVESAKAVLDRTAALISETQASLSGDTVVFCTHGDVASIMLAGLRGHDLGRHRELGPMKTGEIRELRLDGANK